MDTAQVLNGKLLLSNLKNQLNLTHWTSKTCWSSPPGSVLILQLNALGEFLLSTVLEKGLNGHTWWYYFWEDDIKVQVHRVSQEEWTKKEEEFAKKAPGFIEILSEKESKAFDCDKVRCSNQTFFHYWNSSVSAESFLNCISIFLPAYIFPDPITSVFQTLPSEMHAGSLSKFLAVVRPKQGSGVPVKQGMIHPKALDLKLCVSICKPVPPPHKSGSNKSLPIIKQLIWEGSVKGDHVSNNVKGLYLFDPKALGLESKLTRPGTYTFKFELV